MGVPKFFRWLSERYPLINQRCYVPSTESDTLQDQDQDQDQDKEDSSSNNPNDKKLTKKAKNGNKKKKSNKSLKTADKAKAKANSSRVSSQSQSQSQSNLSILINENDLLKDSTLAPQVDRLYIDTNGIIHGCSHNNSSSNDDQEDTTSTTTSTSSSLTNNSNSSNGIQNQEIFDNISTYLDRIVRDVVKPKELVYIAIDGVAPRAKLNQQRSRRYRNTTGNEIEQTVYEAHLDKIQQEKLFTNTQSSSSSSSSSSVTEIQPGRFAGKFETHVTNNNKTHTDSDTDSDNDTDHHSTTTTESTTPHVTRKFHSNQITPGTPFFQECTQHLEAYIQDRLQNDPAWQHLTVIFSGPNVPGEGEHKIMDFIRRQRTRNDYNPNIRHCIQGQDGDLIMLGLLTHEPNLTLLREQVDFVAERREAVAALGMHGYVHNPNFEFLHMNVLRDYLSFDFETSNVVPDSPFDLERTIDDFVFMTFFVGNDFLPAMPALDIADEAFDLLWYNYREHRQRWYEESLKTGVSPYLTEAGNIVSGARLEAFLTQVGSFENAYYYNRKEEEEARLKGIRKADRKYGYNTLPSDDILQSKEDADRAKFREMMLAKQKQDGGGSFAPVLSSFSSPSTTTTTMKEEFQPEQQQYQLDSGLTRRLGDLLQQSVTSLHGGSDDNDNGGDDTAPDVVFDDQDVKGRYYYDKFQFTPFDADKHRALRKAYVEGLVWNLKYYYEGCVSWSWYYPYHYGPMLSDLVDIDDLLQEISFDGKLGEPLRPFEQLLSCMPPSQAHFLPKPFRRLMTSPTSNILDFYPQTFTVDMNGKRWPWEAVVLLPFIDTDRLLAETEPIAQHELTPEEQALSQVGEAVVMKTNLSSRQGLVDKNAPNQVQIEPLESSEWRCATSGFQPEVKSGAEVPLPGYPTLRSAPIRSLWRRRNGTNVFGFPTRYKTAVLEHSHAMPKLPPVESLGESLIGTTVWINYPHLTEAFVTAVSNKDRSVRGQDATVTKFNRKEKLAWTVRVDELVEIFRRGQGVTGTGGLSVSPEQNILLCVRPLQGLREMPDGTQAKVFAKNEIEVPIVATLWAPVQPDPRLINAPALLERDPYRFHERQSTGKKKEGKWQGQAKDSLLKRVDASASDSDGESVQVFKRIRKKLLPDNDPVDLLAPVPDWKKSAGEMAPPIDTTASAGLKTALPSNGKKSTSGNEPRNVEVGKSSRLLPVESSNVLKVMNGESSHSNDEGHAPLSGEPRDKIAAETSFDLFPSTSSHEDVWKPIVAEDDEEPSSLASAEAPLAARTANGCVNNMSRRERNGAGAKETAKSVDHLLHDINGTEANQNAQLWKGLDPERQTKAARKFSTTPYMDQRGLPGKTGTRRFTTAAAVTTTEAAKSRQRFSQPMGRGRGRLAVLGLAATAASFFAAGANAIDHGLATRLSSRRFGISTGFSAFAITRTDPWLSVRGGENLPIRDPYTSAYTGNGDDDVDEQSISKVPPLEFAHGTTTLSFVFQGGAIVAVDSRASMGNFVSSKTTQKVLPINTHMLGTMAGGAADCSVLIRELRSQAMLHELETGKRISTARVSSILARTLYENRGHGLSVGTMIVGYDDNGDDKKSNATSLPNIYYVDDTGIRLHGNLFSAGSGSTFAYAILDTEHHHDLTEDEAVQLGIKAIRYATLRDAFSGGFINVYVVTSDGWKKVFTEDVAVTATLEQPTANIDDGGAANIDDGGDDEKNPQSN
ncbi:5'-3' exoribonuclease [Seminavis robusta]|uniref:proteasome endopeptidase complex n=1 Tax=Seminavis robusta TaxID=568900 RepID=A0A9N8HGV4_9STRA|nr:5'-3' exoribonuclease [Seminavis robusta]|eukprot:Sro662_g183380.1 5'-3' exoribonuclease (1719) ;mRNA; r:27460-32707